MIISQKEREIQEKLQKYKDSVDNDAVKLIESIFRVRNVSGQVVDYKVSVPHQKILRAGILGDQSVHFRIINKGRQAGFSTFSAIENICIAQYFPSTYQYYVAAKEKQAKSWLKKVERIAKDARIMFDGSRIIDIDTKNSNELQKNIRHLPKEIGKEIEESYICGLAASPGGIRGETSLNITLDEFAWMIWRKDLQKQVYESVKYFVSTGGYMTVQSTPLIQTDMFWEMYQKPEQFMMTAYYCPVIENWQELDLKKDLREQKLTIPYWWIDINLLEKARRDDLDFFMQEVLGVPIDSQHRYISPELVYQNIITKEEHENAKKGLIKMAIDVAQARDITAITIGAKVGNIVYELEVVESSATYDLQFDEIKELYDKYKRMGVGGISEIGIDNTGVGRGLGDMIQRSIPVPLKRYEFASKVEVRDNKLAYPVYIATEFKKSLVDGTYKMLEHRAAITHILRVEKIATDTGGIRFSGKATGRDDHFFSKGILNGMFIGEIGSVQPAFFSKGTYGIGAMTTPQRRSAQQIAEMYDNKYSFLS